MVRRWCYSIGHFCHSVCFHLCVIWIFLETLGKSLSSSSSWICLYILAMSADSAIWWNWKRIRIPNRSFKRVVKRYCTGWLSWGIECDSGFSCAAGVFDDAMMWQVETVCARHMNFASENFCHVSKLNEFVNELTISVVNI